MPIAVLALLLIALPAWGAGKSANLLANGSFEDPAEPLRGWRVVYDLPGESPYAENHRYISVIPREEGRPHVLRLEVKEPFAWTRGQGIKTDSSPVPVETAARYRFSAWAKSTGMDSNSPGPNCRIYLEGYAWKPGIKPHPNPELHELRKCFKLDQLYFGAKPSGEMGGVGRSWSKAQMTFPDQSPSKLKQEMWNKVRFVSVHIVGLNLPEGFLFVDDVAIEKLP